ncbi:MAG: ABC transporter ATP-binding protein [Pararhizobium sp.]
MDGDFLRLEGLGKTFGANTVVSDVDLSIGRGEFVSFLGPSGCGKTTILRMIAGFERPTTGRIIVEGRDITHLRPNQRQIGMVFQAYALFPNMSVADNIGFGLKVAGIGRAERRSRTHEMLELIGLPGFEDRFPYQLSGGQQQRVALARALAARPAMLLLDEPLSALDAKIRVSLREQIREIQKELGITTIFVTHDQEEALSMSDRIVVMRAGRAEQVGAPFEIYNRPKTNFVASFVGTLNVLKGTVADPETRTVMIDQSIIAVPHDLGHRRAGDPVSVAVRPEAISLERQPGRDSSLVGRIADVSFLGSVIRVRVGLGANSISLDTFNNPSVTPPVAGAPAHLSFSQSDLILLQD